MKFKARCQLMRNLGDERKTFEWKETNAYGVYEQTVLKEDLDWRVYTRFHITFL